MLIILAYALSVMLTSAVLSMFKLPLFSIITPVILIVNALIVLLCYYAEKHRILGTILILGLLTVVIYITGSVSRTGWNETNIIMWNWMLTAGDEAERYMPYILALTCDCGIFFTFIIYYFSKVQYRISFLTLSSLMPCVLFIKAVEEINNWYLVAIAGLNIAIHIYRNRENEDIVQVGHKAKLFSTSLLIFVVLLVSASIPKERSAKYYDDFQSVFLNGNTTSEVDEDYSGLSDFSGNADNYSSGSNRILYTLDGDESPMLKRQNFDIYDFKRDRWYSLNSHSQLTPSQYTNYASKLQLTMLRAAIEQARVYDANFIRKYNLDTLLDSRPTIDIPQQITIKSKNFGAVYYLNASRAISVSPMDNEIFYVSDTGTFYRKNGAHDDNFIYNIEFYSSNTPFMEWINSGASNIDNEHAVIFLTELCNILKDNNDDLYDYANAFLTQQLNANAYMDAVQFNVDETSEKIRNLAEEITANQQFDWQKAYALQNYFYSDEFSYDLRYKAPDNSPEYFLFESKCGTCSDYASAYVLMARSIGLNARYAEGYVTEYNITSGLYNIMERDSHAYAEVFIENVGWIPFNPTSSNVVRHKQTFMEFLKSLHFDFGLVSVIVIMAVFISVLVIIIRVLFPAIYEQYFRIRLNFMPTDRVCILCLKRIHRKHPETAYMTHREMADYYMERNRDIAELVICLEDILYQQTDISGYSKKNIISQYKKIN